MHKKLNGLTTKRNTNWARLKQPSYELCKSPFPPPLLVD